MASDKSVVELEKEIRRHNRLYFEKNAPEIADYEFDRLVEKLRKLSPDSPVLNEIPSAPGKGLKKVRHTSEMLSLDKCYNDDDLASWSEKFEGDVIAMPKIDGLAVELRYDSKGELVLAATRGDGMTGEDITANVRQIAAIPHKIHFNQRQRRVEGEGATRAPIIAIRGEIYMPLSIFKKSYQDEFANPRNLAAGAVKQKDPEKTKDYRLSFFGYDVLGLPLKSETEKFEQLKKFKIPLVEIKKMKREFAEMKEAYEHFLTKRENHDYETDGVVLKADSVAEQERLGATAHHPRYAIAYKFQGDSGTTTLKEVEWGVARTGVITPVGVVDPVELSGATVTHVSLHNAGLLRKLGLRKQARVVMMRRGGVIPNLESVLEAGRGTAIKIPKKCPSCGFPTEMKDDFLYCTNKDGCRKTKMEELEHFMKVIECDGFGEKLIEKLYDNGFVQDPADFFTLKKEDLLELERMGEVLATKLIANIQAKRQLPLDLFLRSLGIREFAKHASKVLAHHFGSLKEIQNVSEDELAEIHGIGPVIAREVVEGLKKKRVLIDKLLKQVDVGAPLGAPKRGQPAGPLQGKTFLFTGSLLAMERGKAEKLVEELGGEIAGGVTKSLDYLVVGDGGGAGSKLDKAKKLEAKGGKIKILSEKEWEKLVGI
jgi:DNA ligase (NAD+)